MRDVGITKYRSTLASSSFHKNDGTSSLDQWLDTVRGSMNQALYRSSKLGKRSRDDAEASTPLQFLRIHMRIQWNEQHYTQLKTLCYPRRSDELTEAFLFALEWGIPQSGEDGVYIMLLEYLQHNFDAVQAFDRIAYSVLARVHVFKVQPPDGHIYAQDTVARLLDSYTSVLRSIFDYRRDETPKIELTDFLSGIYKKGVAFSAYNNGLQIMIANMLDMGAQLNWKDPYIHLYIGKFLVDCDDYAYDELGTAFARLEENERKRITTQCALRLFRSESGPLGYAYKMTTPATRNGVLFLCKNMHMHMGGGIDPWVDELMDELWKSHETPNTNFAQRTQQRRNNLELMKDLFNEFYAPELQKKVDSFKFPTHKFSIGDKVDCTMSDGTVLRNWEVFSIPSEGTYTIINITRRRDCDASSLSLAKAPSDGAHRKKAPDVVEVLLTKPWTRYMIDNVEELQTIQELQALRERDRSQGDE